MELTAEQRAILAHVLIDVDAWANNAVAKNGEDTVLAKINRWREDYFAKKDLPNYMNRAEREAYEFPEDIAREGAIAANAVVQAAKAQAFIDNLPSRAIVKATINAAFPDTKQNAFITKLADVVYWLAKGTH